MSADPLIELRDTLRAFTREREWVYAVGIAATLFIYARNLWLIYAYGNESAEAGD